jgi:predicted HicB family RNase H-like nuclease
MKAATTPKPKRLTINDDLHRRLKMGALAASVTLEKFVTPTLESLAKKCGRSNQ